MNTSYNIKTGKISNLQQYRISDNYTNFYLNYIEPQIKLIEQGLWLEKSLSILPEFNTVIGIAFENLVLNNLTKIYDLLEVKPESIKFAGPYFSRKTKDSEGVQIDLLIVTKDIIYVTEVKFRRGKIDKSIIPEMQRKCANIPKPKHMSYRCVLVHVNGLTEDLEDNKYFDYVIDFGQIS